MLKLFGATIAATTLALAGSAGAMTLVLESGMVNETSWVGSGNFAVPLDTFRSWEIALTTSGQVQLIDAQTYGKHHYHYDYDDGFSWARTETIVYPATITRLSNGFVMRFDIPADQRYRVDLPGGAGYDYWDDWHANFYAMAKVVVGDGPESYSITATSVPEPATWAMMIVGFGLVGSTMRRRRAALA